MATNLSVPIVYPKLSKKYGDVITYAEDRIAHMRMEFGFDVLEVAKGNYASQAYHNFIGFKVDTAVLSQAFFETYGIRIKNVFKNHFDLGIETFRWIVANIFPTLTKAAWSAKKKTIKAKNNGVASKHFQYRMRQKQYNKQFGKGYQRPGASAKILSLFIRALPKIGPLRALKFKSPTPESEKLFVRSFDTILVYYASSLKQLSQKNIHPKDMDFDTGKPTVYCEYSLANQTYIDWMFKLEGDKYKNVTDPIRQNILHFFHLQKAAAPQKYSKQCSRFFTAYHQISTLSINH